jgi:hypothetical protein
MKKKKKYATEETKRQPIFKTLEREVNYMQLFFGGWKVYHAVKKRTGTLALWLAEKCDKDNNVVIDKFLIDQFNQELVENGYEAYGRSSIMKATRELTEYGFLTKIGNARYRINPNTVWKDSQKKRDELLTQISSSESQEVSESKEKLEIVQQKQSEWQDIMTTAAGTEPDNPVSQSQTEIDNPWI